MLKGLWHHLYPATCVLCDAPGYSGLDICASCVNDLVTNDSACIRCALPVPVSSGSRICGECLKAPPSFDAAWSPFLYQHPLKWMIHQLKFNAKLVHASVLSSQLLSRLPEMDVRPDCLIPVPLHDKRLKQRGFNQALELLKPISRELDIPIDTHSCLRQKQTSAQTGLGARQRRKNLNRAFHFRNTEQYKNIVLFDDVITTGSTMNELTREIKRQGVRRVDVWSLARADKSHG